MSSTPTLTETVKPPKKKFKLEDDRFVANIEEKIRENQVSSLKENPNSIPNLCPNCLLLLSLCICPQLPSPFGLIGRMSNLMDVIIYSHFNEIMHESACNTGRWLMWAGAKSVISGYKDNEEAMRQEILRRPRGSVMVLFPSNSAVTITDFHQQHAAAIPHENDPLAQSLPSLDAPSLFPNSPAGRPLVIVLDATWSLAKTLDKRLNLLLSEFVSDPAQWATRVRLSRSCRGDIGSFRRVSRNEKNKGQYAQELGVSIGQPPAHQQARDVDRSVLQDRDVAKVSTLQAFMVLLEEMFSLPEGSYRGTYERYKALVQAEKAGRPTTYEDVIAKENPLPDALAAVPIEAEPAAAGDEEVVYQEIEPVDVSGFTAEQRLAHHVVCEMAYILRTSVIYYHAHTFLKKGELLPPDARAEAAQLLRRMEEEREAHKKQRLEERATRRRRDSE